MLRRLVTISLALVFTWPIAAAQSVTVHRKLEPMFAAANADAAQIVPLILEGTAAIGSLDAGEARLLADTLDPYCARAFFSPERLLGEQRLGIATHVVRSGDIGTRIAQRYRIGAGLLRYLNQDYDENRLRIGQKLKVIDLSDRSLRIEVHKSLYRMFVWRARPEGPAGASILIASFPVGLGASESPTPEGRTTIAKRVLDPQWTHPVTRQVFEADDPGNVLGGYWVALDPAGIGRSGIGFHGYTGEVAVNWIEQPASHGCVRLLQLHVDRVFHLAVEGTPVEIVR